MVGTSGNAEDRFLLIVTSTRNEPAFASGAAAVSDAKQTCVSPARTASVAGPLPLYGTCTMSRLSFCLNCSPSKWEGVPTPAEAKLNLPGVERMSATSSLTSFAATDLLTESAVGNPTANDTGAKSLTGS